MNSYLAILRLGKRIRMSISVIHHFSLLVLFLSFSSTSLIASGMLSDSTLTLQSNNGKVKRVLRGVTYNVVYDAYAGSSTISPNNNGEITNEGVGITISGAPTAIEADAFSTGMFVMGLERSQELIKTMKNAQFSEL